MVPSNSLAQNSSTNDPYEAVLQEVFKNYSPYRALYWNSRQPSRIRVHLSDWLIYKVEEEGNLHPLVSVQVLVTLRWRDNLVRGWSRASAIPEDELHVSMDSHRTMPIITPKMGVFPELDLHILGWGSHYWEKLLVRRDGLLSTSFYIQMKIPMSYPIKDTVYPLDKYERNAFLTGKNPWSYSRSRMVTSCDRTDLSGRCDGGLQQGVSTDQRWKWSVSLIDYGQNAAYIRAKLIVERNIVEPEDATERINIPSGMTFDWTREGFLPRLSGLAVLAQYLMPFFVREKFILGFLNLLLLTMCLQHYDSQPALQVDDRCPWINYYSGVFYLQVVALLWFALRTFLYYNSTILLWLNSGNVTEGSTTWSTVKTRFMKTLFVLTGMGINPKDHIILLQKLHSLEKEQHIFLPQGGDLSLKDPSGATFLTEMNKSQSPTSSSERVDLVTGSSQVVPLSQQIAEQIHTDFGSFYTSVETFLLVCMSLDRLFFLLNGLVLTVLHMNFA